MHMMRAKQVSTTVADSIFLSPFPTIRNSIFNTSETRGRS